mmetsp:Transcript_83137/g.243767  ORF Transcript_83137/g.243767 Transcript_83137/m.243767 type:complete len:323 (+) Transcript_83137:243-1211(+)
MLVHALRAVPVLAACIRVLFPTFLFAGRGIAVLLSLALISGRAFTCRLRLRRCGRGRRQSAVHLPDQQPLVQQLLPSIPAVELPLKQASVVDLVQVAGDPRLDEDFVVHRALFVLPLLCVSKKGLQRLVVAVRAIHACALRAWQRLCNDKVEEALDGNRRPRHALAEEVVHVDAVALQEVKRLGMVTFHGLRDVNDVEPAAAVEHVVLGKISMDQATPLHHLAHDPHTVYVQVEPLIRRQPFHILKAWGRIAILANELHDKHILSQLSNFRAPNANSPEALQVAHLLFSPLSHHLAGIALAIAMPEPVLPLHIPCSVLEDQD